MKSAYLKTVKNPLYTGLLTGVLFFLASLDLAGQPFYNTHIKNRYVDENVFLSMKADSTQPPVFNSGMAISRFGESLLTARESTKSYAPLWPF